MSFQIVPMAEKHLPQVAALERLCFPAGPWSEGLFRSALESPNTAVLLAEGAGGEVLGYAVLSAVLDEGSLDNIAVHPGFRRRGIADALLSACVRFGRDRLAFLTLEVRPSNAPAVKLYEKHGFVPVGRRKHYYDDPKEDALLMTLYFGGDPHGCRTTSLYESLSKDPYSQALNTAWAGLFPPYFANSP